MTTPYLAVALSCREIIAADGFAFWKMRAKSLKIENINDVHVLPIINGAVLPRLFPILYIQMAASCCRFVFPFVKKNKQAAASDETTSTKSVRFRLEHAFLADEHCRCLRRPRNRR